MRTQEAFPSFDGAASTSQSFSSSQQYTNHTPTISTALVPGQLYVCKRDGVRVAFDPKKITVAITKAFLAAEGGQMAMSDAVHSRALIFTDHVVERLKRRAPTGGLVHIEDIQDQVELTLMREGEHKVAQSYVIYRNERAKERQSKTEHNERQFQVTMPDGAEVTLDSHFVHQLIANVSQGVADIDHNLIYSQGLNNVYDGIAMADFMTAFELTCHTLVEQDPNYGFVAARFLQLALMQEVNAQLSFAQSTIDLAEAATYYPQAFTKAIEFGIAKELVNPQLATSFDLARLADAINPERDKAFDYLGMRTLYDRYFLHCQGQRFELPQVFFMRVAMGLALQEDQPTERAIEFYCLLSDFDFMSSTPTLFNSGTTHSQLSSCYLSTVPDDLDGIFTSIRENALLSKWAGGLGNDWTPVRAINSSIKGTNGKSQGVVPFLKVANDTAVAVNQGGKRKGALCAYLETWHLDIEQFLDLRKNTGDDRRRTHDMNTANWIPDLFMQRVMEDAPWTLFSPSDTPDLHDLYGTAFQERYEHYEQEADAGRVDNFKRLPAKQLWRKMLTAIFETGHPWITFKDPCNLRSPQQHAGVVHSSNLCTEITLNTNQEEIAVCNLGSINVKQHITDGKLDTKKLKRTVTTAIRMLDNVIDINFYVVEKARDSNMRHRPIGLGIMGFHDALIAMNIPYASEEAVEFADRSMEHISYYAIEASAQLAQQRGSYQSFEGSLWSKGILPYDSIKLLKQARGEAYLDIDESTTLEWSTLRTKVQKGMRNSNLMAIAPTATIGNIIGVSKSIEPNYQNLHVASNLSGEFKIFNRLLVEELKARGLWDKAMIKDLKFFEGDVSQIERIPQPLVDLYATAFQIHPKWLIACASRRQKWIDQAQSLNLFMGSPNGAHLDKMYRMAWYQGLKTTYYLRSLGASSAEKSTVDDKASLNRVAARASTPTPTPACSLDEGCESCQ